MIKRLWLLIVLTLLLISPIITPHITRAETSISILESSIDIYFPSAFIFNIKAESSSDITKIRLHYQVDRMNYAQVISESWLRFTPATTVQTKWIWDTRKASLPPGADIKYWWTIEDTNGNRLETPPSLFHLSDIRYKWQELTTPRLTLFWYEGNQIFARELLATCEEGLDRLARDIGAYPEKPIKVYIYANSQDLQGAMIFPTEWTGGAAYTEYGIVALGISQANLNWGKRALVHELAHLVVSQVTFGPYGAIMPIWLNEGLAMYAEGDTDPDFEKWLNKAIADKKLISIRSLSSVFSAKTEEAYISYAQSDSIVRFLIQSYGKDRILELLSLLKEGNTYDEALTKAYGFDTEGLDTHWQSAFVVKPVPFLEKKPLHPTLIAILSALATIAALIIAFALEEWRWQRRSWQWSFLWDNYLIRR